MELTHKIEELANSQHSKTLDVVRIVLGLIIFGKGLLFISNTDAIFTMMANSKVAYGGLLLVHYTAMVHLVGGLLIMGGLLTRVAVAFQLPILLGAILFVNARHGFFSMQSELEFSILVFCLLLYFLFYGSGPLSLDEYLRKNRGV